MSKINPPVVVENRQHQSKNYFVARDDLLFGGTKQRALKDYLELFPDIETFVYGGPDLGYAQLALSHTVNLLNKKCVIFLQSANEMPNFLTRKAIAKGAECHLITDTIGAVVQRAKDYVTYNQKSMFVPFGLEDETYLKLAIVALSEALKDVVPPKRVWITSGSGTLLRTLATIWPKTKLLIVKVGKDIYLDEYEESIRKRIEIYDTTARYKSTQDLPRELRPPYPSLPKYDAKIWIFASLELQEGDYIWNVGGY